MSQSGRIEVGALRKSFQINRQVLPVLEGIDLSVDPGEFVCIAGPSGCGKSTLLRLLAGLDVADSGSLALDGQAIVGTSLERGLVFQEHRLLPWLTVEQNVAFGLLNAPGQRAAHRRSVDRHLELVGLSDFATAFPSQLSGGMAQRVAIARALAARPKVLLLDEPFGALDPLTRTRLQRELQDIWQRERLTMVMVTHDIDEALFLGNRVIVMQPRPGRIAVELDNPLPFPRDRASPAFEQLERQLLGLLS